MDMQLFCSSEVMSVSFSCLWMQEYVQDACNSEEITSAQAAMAQKLWSFNVRVQKLRCFMSKSAPGRS